MDKNSILLVAAVLCTVGCDQEQTQQPSPLPIENIPEKNEFITQSSSDCVAGFYYHYNVGTYKRHKKITFIEWKVRPYLSKLPAIEMRLVGNFEVRSGRGISIHMERSYRGSAYVTPQQLEAICASLSKGKEWSNIAIEQNLNVQSKELYSEEGNGSEGIAINFTQERGATNYLVTIQIGSDPSTPIDPFSLSSLEKQMAPRIILDAHGVEHFVKTIDVVLQELDEVLAAQEKAKQEKAARQTQEKTDAKEADLYLK